MHPLKPTPRKRGVRYVNVRLAVPDGSSPGEVIDYLQSNNPFNNNVDPTANNFAAPAAKTSPLTTLHAAAPLPFTFLPVVPDDMGSSIHEGTPLSTSSKNDNFNQTQNRTFAPINNNNNQAFSPAPSLFSTDYDCRKTAASPSMTNTTMDSSTSSFGRTTTPSPSNHYYRRTATPSPNYYSALGGFVSPLAIPPTLAEEEDTTQTVVNSRYANTSQQQEQQQSQDVFNNSHSFTCISTPTSTSRKWQSPSSPALLAFATPTIAASAITRMSTTTSTSPSTIGSKSGSVMTKNGSKKSAFAREDDSVRKTRIKTELCMHYEKGNPCPFGSNCTYAHGQEELQMTKLLDLHRAGLIDVETYRTKPCLTWTTTGSCPFGRRCAGIHDKRATGEHASWLPHTETQGNTIDTDINVEGLHQKRLYSLLYDNPFGRQFSLDFDDWESLYKLVCNTTDKSTRRRRCNIAQIHKVGIAIQMKGPSDWTYKFRPQHIIHDELCMVLQKRAFKLKDSGDVLEIPVTSFNPRSPNQVVVREIAFGPDCDPSVRNVALWFHIQDDDVTVCTPQQAKRYRWKRGLNNNSPEKKIAKERTQTSVFDHLECFFMVRPDDREAYDLTNRILEHRLEVLRFERSTKSLRERSEVRLRLEREEAMLQTQIESQIEFWKRWAWPISKGREEVNESTPVPEVDANYVMSSETAKKLLATHKIWESFVSRNTNCSRKIEGRLSVFQRLAEGQAIGLDRYLPHIRCVGGVQTLKQEAELCWRSLLLQSSSNEWGLVREHFENSRTKKNISLLQQLAK